MAAKADRRNARKPPLSTESFSMAFPPIFSRSAGVSACEPPTIAALYGGSVHSRPAFLPHSANSNASVAGRSPHPQPGGPNVQNLPKSAGRGGRRLRNRTLADVLEPSSLQIGQYLVDLLLVEPGGGQVGVFGLELLEHAA